MRICILTAILGGFDFPVDPVKQELPEGITVDFHRFTDEDFKPITGLTPRFQYRIPKMFGWQMFQGDYDYYFWLDGSVSLRRSDCIRWYLEQIGDNDIAFFKHPDRKTIKQETEHIEKKLKEGNKYIEKRYGNGLHKEQYAECMADPEFKDEHLYASTAFFYKNTKEVREMMKDWFYNTARFWTVDQIALSYALFKSGIKVKKIDEHLFKTGYLSLVSNHNNKPYKGK